MNPCPVLGDLGSDPGLGKPHLEREKATSVFCWTIHGLLSAVIGKKWDMTVLSLSFSFLMIKGKRPGGLSARAA